jgi:hypothetical protein
MPRAIAAINRKPLSPPVSRLSASSLPSTDSTLGARPHQWASRACISGFATHGRWSRSLRSSNSNRGKSGPLESAKSWEPEGSGLDAAALRHHARRAGLAARFGSRGSEKCLRSPVRLGPASDFAIWSTSSRRRGAPQVGSKSA